MLWIFIICLHSLHSIESQNENLKVLDSKVIDKRQQIELSLPSINIRYDLKLINESIDELRNLCPVCVERHLVQHYLTRGCTPVVKGGCECPSRYECPSQLTSTQTSVCKWRGRQYSLGDTVMNEDSCRVCKCISTDGTNMSFDCNHQIDCHDEWTQPTQPTQWTHCNGFAKCCPQVNCSAKFQVLHNNCKYKGLEYRFGEHIDVLTDRCMSCVCKEGWDERNATNSCTLIDCDLNADHRFRLGCTPVYSLHNCCPIDYNCPKRNGLRIRGLGSGSLMCEFEGRKYTIGSTLYSSNKCYHCLCQIPPQFTCIQIPNCY